MFGTFHCQGMGVPVEGKEQTAEVDQLPGLICWDVRNTSCVLSLMWSAIILVPFCRECWIYSTIHGFLL